MRRVGGWAQARGSSQWPSAGAVEGAPAAAGRPMHPQPPLRRQRSRVSWQQCWRGGRAGFSRAPAPAETRLVSAGVACKCNVQGIGCGVDWAPHCACMATEPFTRTNVETSMSTHPRRDKAPCCTELGMAAQTQQLRQTNAAAGMTAQQRKKGNTIARCGCQETRPPTSSWLVSRCCALLLLTYTRTLPGHHNKHHAHTTTRPSCTR